MLEQDAGPVHAAQLEALMRRVEADAAVGGWDQRPVLYRISGTLDDPWLRRVPVPGAVGTVASVLGSLPVLVDRRGLGVAFVHEAWTLKLGQERMRQLHASFQAQGIAEADMASAFKAWADDFQRRTPVSSLPPELRVEQRLVHAALRDGTFLTLTRDRDDEPEMLPPNTLRGPVQQQLARLAGADVKADG